MQGLMMDYPLTLPHILERSAKLFPRKEIASKMADGIHRYTYADFHRRTHALARGLEQTRHPAGRPGRHFMLEQFTPSGTIFCGYLLRRRPAHAQPSPGVRPAGVSSSTTPRIK